VASGDHAGGESGEEASREIVESRNETGLGDGTQGDDESVRISCVLLISASLGLSYFYLPTTATRTR
jgi:hypothetical protein